MGTLKTHINVNHIEEERWGLPLVDYDWYASCQALYEGMEGDDWGMYESYEEWGSGSKEAAGDPKSKGFVGHEGSQRQRIFL